MYTESPAVCVLYVQHLPTPAANRNYAVPAGHRLIKNLWLKSPVLVLECGRLWRCGVYYGLAMKIKGILRFCLLAYMKAKAHMSI